MSDDRYLDETVEELATVRHLRPGPFAGDDLDLTDAQLVDEAARVNTLRDDVDGALILAPAAILAGPNSALARHDITTLGGVLVTVLDELPGGADVMLAYSVPPLPDPEPPRKAHG